MFFVSILNPSLKNVCIIFSMRFWGYFPGLVEFHGSRTKTFGDVLDFLGRLFEIAYRFYFCMPRNSMSSRDRA